MRKSIAFMAIVLMASVCSAQTLDEIVNRYYAANGTEILEKASTIFMEGNMSQMGTEMPMTLMVKKPNKVKVVISSGYSHIGPRKETLKSGAKGFIGKPYEMKELLQVVRQVLDQD